MTTANEESSPFLDTFADALLQVRMKRPNATTRVMEPAAGITGGRLRISATEQGGAIGVLDYAATEATGKPGTYWAVADLADLTSALPALTYPHGSTVYIQFYKAGDVAVKAFPKSVRRFEY